MIAETQIHQLLYREACLMDEHRYADWLALWSEDGIYWVPCNGEGKNPDDEVAIIYDSYERLKDRIARLESGTVIAQSPQSAMRRLISNIEVGVAEGGVATVLSNFMLIEARAGQQFLWAGRSTHKLRQTNGTLQIVFKKVVLVNNDQELPPMQFLL
jgi:3-phenylpropionate/cinnamic acid dioxygenase small subunit